MKIDRWIIVRGSSMMEEPIEAKLTHEEFQQLLSVAYSHVQSAGEDEVIFYDWLNKLCYDLGFEDYVDAYYYFK